MNCTPSFLPPRGVASPQGAKPALKLAYPPSGISEAPQPLSRLFFYKKSNKRERGARGKYLGAWLQIIYIYKSFLPYNESLPVPLITLLY